MRFLILIMLTLFTLSATAYVVPTYRDIKPASQAMLEYQRVLAPVVAATNHVLTTNAGPTSAATVVVSAFTAQPDVARLISITPTGTTTDVESCAVVIVGQNILNKALTDTLTFAANASTAQTSIKAFKSISSITWPASCESGGFAASWIVGVTDALGLKRCMKQAGDVAWTVFDSVFEATRATCISNASDVSKNTCDPNGTLNGAKNVDFYFVQNFACLP